MDHKSNAKCPLMSDTQREKRGCENGGRDWIT